MVPVRAGAFPAPAEVDRSGQGIPDHTGKAAPRRVASASSGPGTQEAPGRGLQPLADGDDLVCGLPFAEDHLGMALA